MAQQLDAQLRQAIAAARGGRHAEAQRLLAAVLSADPYNEAGWLWMSAVVTGRADRIRCLQRVTAINPDNEMAIKGLRMLHAAPDGRTIRRSRMREQAPEGPPPPARPAAEAKPEPADEVDPFAVFDAPPAEPVAPVAPEAPAGPITDADLYDIFGPPPGAEPDAPVAPAAPAPQEPADDLPDWVTPLTTATKVQSLADVALSEAEEPPAAEPAAPTLLDEAAADDLPGWLEAVAAEAEAEPLAPGDPGAEMALPAPVEPLAPEAAAEPETPIDLDEPVGAPPEGEETPEAPGGVPLIGAANVARAQREAETVIEAIREARRLREPVIQWHVPPRQRDA